MKTTEFKAVINRPYDGNDPEVVFGLFRAFLREFYPQFDIDDTNIGPIEYLAEIAAGTAPKKGLILRGTVGTGKTLLVLLFFRFRKLAIRDEYQDRRDGRIKRKKPTFLDPRRMMGNFLNDGVKFLSRSFNEILFIDDIGEVTEVNHFGTKINLVTEIIGNRYQWFKHNPNMELIATTNLTSKRLIDVAGERTFSRLMEMAEWDSGLLTGSDRRLNPNALEVWPEMNIDEPRLSSR